jgi:tetratricopeptide (TPR) repeat protein
MRVRDGGELSGGVVGEGDGRDFFVSYAGVNESWARWICVQLERAGYSTVSQVLDFRPGRDFVHAMQVAVTSATRTVAVLSPAYFESRFGEAEWQVAFRADPSGERGLLVPVRVQPCTPPGLLAARVYVDLVDLGEPAARERLLAAVGPPPRRPTTAPFPGAPPTGVSGAAGAGGVSRFPGAGPAVSNLPGRNRNFSGRHGLLTALHGRMRAGSVAAVLPVEAVHGLGGVGKTELAVEFAHRFGSDFDIVWWVPAEQPVTAAAALGELAGRLGVPATADQTARIGALFDVLRGRDRWLLIYDNAEDPEALRGLVPPIGDGSVLVTSRWAAWGRHAEPLRVDVLDRGEALAFLTRRTGLADTDGLAVLAELVGDLPLALEEAAAYLEQTRVGLDTYLTLLRDRARDLFGLAASGDPTAGLVGLAGLGAEADQRRVATVWSVSLDRIRGAAPEAEALLDLFAFLAPTIPRALAPAHPEVLPEALAAAVTDPVRYNALLAVAGRYSLIELNAAEIGVHRLVQAVIRAQLHPDQERATVQSALELLRAAFPNDSSEPVSWAACEMLLPHVLAVADHAQRLAVGAVETGWLLDRASTYLRERGQYRQALPLAAGAVSLTEAALGPQHLEVAWRRYTLAGALQALGRFAETRDQYETILQIAEAVETDDNTTAIWRNGFGDGLQDLGDLPGARTEYERVLQIGETALGPDHPTVGTARNGLGGVLHNLGDLAGARTQLERALQIGEAALGPDHPSVGTTRSNLGGVLYDLGDLAGARTQLERALQIGEAVLGPDHPDVGAWRGNLGTLLHNLGELPGARTQLERALQIGEAALGPDHPEIGIQRNNLGRVLQDLGELPGARTQYERALQINEAALGPDHPQTRQVRRNLDDVL